MALEFTDGDYPYVTLIMDRHGCVHMWEGQQEPYFHPTRPLANGSEAETFIQFQSDIDAVIDCLDQMERKMLNMGHAIQTKHIPDDMLFREY